MKKINLVILLAIICSAGNTSCIKTEPEEPFIPNEEEVITTLIYTLTPSNFAPDVVLSFQDLDGDGGNAPVIISGDLNTNTTYTATLQLYNELVSPKEDITIEVKEEGDEHQFFFQTSINGLEINYDDTDSNGDPIGIVTKVSTKQAGSGVIKVILRHEPNKKAGGVVNGDITNAGGETDIEISFLVDVI